MASDSNFIESLNNRFLLNETEEYTPSDYDYLYYAIKKQNVSIIKLFVEAIHLEAINVQVIRETENVEPLAFTIAKYGNAEIADLIFPFLNGQLDLYDNSGRTPAHWAAEKGRWTLLKRLAPHLNLLSLDEEGLSPLHLGYIHAHIGVIKFYRDYFPELNLAEHKTRKSAPLRNLIRKENLSSQHKFILEKYLN